LITDLLSIACIAPPFLLSKPIHYLVAENDSTAGLRENTVFFTDGVKNFFQMKPYTSPSLGELQEFLAGLE
jgi:hypothetical protein